jgi:PTH1 family peptidyl-tRNA hydrolase
MKFLVVGLGNPGFEYENTRHNIGFKVLDALASASNAVFSTGRLGEIAHAKYKGRVIVLLKPNTYMNLSGKAVRYWLQAEKIEMQNLVVVTDDIALPLAKLRLRLKGSDGGHNGLKDIALQMNTQEFARLRFGVGNDFSKGNQADFVLGKWLSEEEILLKPAIEKSVQALQQVFSLGVEKAMNTVNA